MGAGDNDVNNTVGDDEGHNKNNDVDNNVADSVIMMMTVA